jgi:hypothetical protein
MLTDIRKLVLPLAPMIAIQTDTHDRHRPTAFLSPAPPNAIGAALGPGGICDDRYSFSSKSDQ